MRKTLFILIALLAVSVGFMNIHSGHPTARAPQPFDLSLAGYDSPAATSLSQMVSGVRSIKFDAPKTVSYGVNTVWYSIATDGDSRYLLVQGRQISGVVNREAGTKIVRVEAITNPKQREELASELIANAPGHDVRFRDPE